MRFAADPTIRQSTTQKQWSWSFVARLVWAVLFLIHIVPLVSVGSKLAVHPTFNLVISMTAIVGIMTFALLKALDVRSLRIQLTGRKWLTLLVLGLFFHGDVVAKTLPDLMLAESTMVVLVSIVCGSRELRSTINKVVVSTSLLLRKALYVLLEEFTPTPVVPIYALLCSPRPPPQQ